jgi:hypothetical protein
MIDWLFTWKGPVLAAVILISAVAVGIVFREGTLGNVASIAGFAVSVLGFVVTIWTVHDARQQIKDASDRAEKAVAQANEETRRAIRGIAAQLRAADCAALRNGIEDRRQAAQDAKWPRAVYRCQECRLVTYRLALDPHLTGDETSTLRQAADDLLLILRFIEKNRLAGQEGLLQKGHVRSLDDVIGLLAQIQARLHHEPLRDPRVFP